MGEQKNPDQQNPGYTDQKKKRENERAGQNPCKDWKSNPERGKKHDPQLDPSHIHEDPTPESTR